MIESFARRTSLVGLALALCACVAPSTASRVENYDLGLAAGATARLRSGVREVRVVGPSWLESRAMQYRLNFDQPARRHSYALARWVAPPAELLQRQLEGSLAGGGGRCLLRVDLDEWVQVFSSPQQATVTVVFRASLQVPKGEILAAQPFRLVSGEIAPNSQGAVSGAAEVVLMAEQSIGNWLSGQAEFAQRCAGAPSQ